MVNFEEAVKGLSFNLVEQTKDKKLYKLVRGNKEYRIIYDLNKPDMFVIEAYLDDMATDLNINFISKRNLEELINGAFTYFEEEFEHMISINKENTLKFLKKKKFKIMKDNGREVILKRGDLNLDISFCGHSNVVYAHYDNSIKGLFLTEIIYNMEDLDYFINMLLEHYENKGWIKICSINDIKKFAKVILGINDIVDEDDVISIEDLLNSSKEEEIYYLCFTWDREKIIIMVSNNRNFQSDIYLCINASESHKRSMYEILSNAGVRILNWF